MAATAEQATVSNRCTELVSRLRTTHSLNGQRPWAIEVPLRICPLGAHIDHQGGTVTGMAVDRSVMMVAVPSDGPGLEIDSLTFPGSVSLDVSSEQPPRDGCWGDYVRAATTALGERHPLRRGFKAVITGELAGSGLSSSAAVLIAYLKGLAHANGIELENDEVVGLVQRAENAYVGVASGLLDQSVMVHAESGSLTTIDCRDLRVGHIEAPRTMGGFAILVAYSGAGRLLVDSGYNNRVSECRSAAGSLLEAAGSQPGPVPKLRDVDPEVFAEFGRCLPPDLHRRANHYFSEMERVAAGVAAWRSGDLARFGALVTASGESSIVNYECGTAPLISLYRLLIREPGVFGARFSGGGFGGSCIALAEPEACDDVIASVSRRYAEEHPDLARTAALHVCAPAGPVRTFQTGS